MFFFYDYWYILLVMPTLLLALWAQFRVKSTFRKYSRMESRAHLSGYDSARMVLDRYGLRDVRIEEIDLYETCMAVLSPIPQMSLPTSLPNLWMRMAA